MTIHCMTPCCCRSCVSDSLVYVMVPQSTRRFHAQEPKSEHLHQNRPTSCERHGLVDAKCCCERRWRSEFGMPLRFKSVVAETRYMVIEIRSLTAKRFFIPHRHFIDFHRKRDGEVVLIDPKRMEGGDVDSIALKIRDVTRYDLGNYTCELENEFGLGVSSNSINVDVHCEWPLLGAKGINFIGEFKHFLVAPIVELVMEPDTPIIENNEVNVTLMCRVLSGNPATLTRVTWFLDGGILKELPECNGDDGDNSLCGVDPDVLLLENVGRHFLGNYSCQGQNQAGVGNRSAENDLIVFYEPGNATLFHYPLVASKRKSVTFFCSVEDGGNPNATRYSWSRGGSVLQHDTAMVTFDNIGLDSRTNFSCYAYNEGGKGRSTSVELKVQAQPAFIQNLQPRTAALFSSVNVSLSCRVECVPACTILWFKNNMGIEKSDERYYINETYVPADMAVGDFESVLSVLHFNMSAWPDNKLDIYKDNANYSCVSSGNSEGAGVRSETVFHVECTYKQYPFENRRERIVYD